MTDRSRSLLRRPRHVQAPARAAGLAWLDTAAGAGSGTVTCMEPDPAGNATFNAAVLGAMEATQDVYVTKLRGKDEALLTAHNCDGGRDNLLESVPFSAIQAGRVAARTAATTGVLLDARSLVAEAIEGIVTAGPRSIRQLPAAVDKHETGGGDERAALIRTWERRARKALTRAGEPWITAVERRLQVQHPRVRVAVLTAAPDLFARCYTLSPLEFEEIRAVPGKEHRLTGITALVHPNEAEALLRENGKSGRVRLLPSLGVSADRIEAALTLHNAPRPKHADTPTRSLLHCLVAAAGVLNEPVFDAPEPGLDADAVRAAAIAMMPDAPGPKPRNGGNTGIVLPGGPGFALAA